MQSTPLQVGSQQQAAPSLLQPDLPTSSAQPARLLATDNCHLFNRAGERNKSTAKLENGGQTLAGLLQQKGSLIQNLPLGNNERE